MRNKNEIIFELKDIVINNVETLPAKKNFYTKAGQISFSGQLSGKKVKIYTNFNTRQARLRNYLGSFCSDKISLPEVIFKYDNIVCEEWIYGQQVSKKKITNQLEFDILKFIDKLEAFQIPQRYKDNNFCYVEDYLLSRFDVWKNFKFAQSRINTLENLLKSRVYLLDKKLNHPDISPRNLIYEKRRDRYFLIDNELLGFGFGWLVSRLNFFQSIKKDPDIYSDDKMTKLLWEMRTLISELESNSFAKDGFFLKL